ncbi:high-affinity choline transporter 1-like [Clytia hemisphaerica]|uniref:Uncharacterized protein n=1 Tax=Clytia hemisphaerica TaxID=252671 RepID=A0A7M5WMP0_9CNID|eukprot:TCONS_00053673-protein
MADLNVAGLISIIIFYLAILGIGLFAAWRKNKHTKENAQTTQDETNEVILAGRTIGMFIGCFTMTATWVGGGYINGTAESVYNDGLVWAQAPWGYATSLAMGGFFFARKMREAEYITMLDPLQDKYGRVMGAFLYIPAFLGETFWSASILAALGATLTVILGLNMNISVIVSACIAVGYTFFGGLYSVAYTDVVQLICIAVGLWLTVPFSLTNENVESIGARKEEWLGQLYGAKVGKWIDYAFLLICGGIPWQVYFQRVLSSKSAHRAQILSFVAAFGCIVLAIPAVLIGAAAKSADWGAVSGAVDANLVTNKTGEWVITDTRLVLPMVLQYLAPGWVSFIGLGAISAAVMSSADSSVLSASSMFGHNIYKLIIRKNASANEIIWVIRIGIIFVGIMATLVGLTVDSIYALFHLCSDLVFVILFPQLVGAVHIQDVNTYGSICAYIVGLFLRITGGEELIGFPATFKYPYYDETYSNGKGSQNFPFRTLAMIISFITLVSVSKLAYYLFDNEILGENYDFLGVLERRRNLAGKKGRRGEDDALPLQEKYNGFDDPTPQQI